MTEQSWRVAAASVRGLSHEQTGKSCEDANECAVLDDGTLIVAVADGAGSASRAEEGSHTAVRAALAALCEAVAVPEGETPRDDDAWKAVLVGAASQAKAAVEAAASAAATPLREFASTLLLAVARPELLVAAQIGDGAVVFCDKDGTMGTATKPSHGEFINETTFLISAGAIDGMQFVVRRGALGQVAMFSDGLQMVSLEMPAAEPFAPFFQPLFRFLGKQQDDAAASEQLAEFLRSPRLRERADDDLTLVIAMPLPLPAESPRDDASTA